MRPRPTETAEALSVLPSGETEAVTDIIAEETPVALVYNNVSHAVMLATPADLGDFALGFSLSEGILARKDELLDLATYAHKDGIEVRMAIDLARFNRLKERRRNLVGRTGCGLCGVDSLKEAIRDQAPIASRAAFEPRAIYRALDALGRGQVLNRATRAVHGAAFADAAGEIVLLREDVGRHNALDKLIGALARAGIDPGQGFVLVTSRCSVEMVQKTVALGSPLLVAVSAPTALARRLAERLNLGLVAVARNDGFKLYAHGERVRAAKVRA